MILPKYYFRLNDPRKWKGSYFCSSQKSQYSILVRKSALLFCISPLQVLKTKWLVENFLSFYRPYFESKSTNCWCLYAQNRKSFQNKKEKSFFRFTVFEIWRKVPISIDKIIVFSKKDKWYAKNSSGYEFIVI